LQRTTECLILPATDIKEEIKCDEDIPISRLKLKISTNTKIQEENIDFHYENELFFIEYLDPIRPDLEEIVLVKDLPTVRWIKPIDGPTVIFEYLYTDPKNKEVKQKTLYRRAQLRDEWTIADVVKNIQNSRYSFIKATADIVLSTENELLDNLEMEVINKNLNGKVIRIDRKTAVTVIHPKKVVNDKSVKASIMAAPKWTLHKLRQKICQHKDFIDLTPEFIIKPAEGDPILDDTVTVENIPKGDITLQPALKVTLELGIYGRIYSTAQEATERIKEILCATKEPLEFLDEDGFVLVKDEEALIEKGGAKKLTVIDSNCGVVVSLRLVDNMDQSNLRVYLNPDWSVADLKKKVSTLFDGKNVKLSINYKGYKNGDEISEELQDKQIMSNLNIRSGAVLNVKVV
jgi:hypothetical protein